MEGIANMGCPLWCLALCAVLRTNYRVTNKVHPHLRTVMDGATGPNPASVSVPGHTTSLTLTWLTVGTGIYIDRTGGSCS
ncbi:hypothetical protein BDW71DRAFT_186127 [Aspergillus fruticulosus]